VSNPVRAPLRAACSVVVKKEKVVATPSPVSNDHERLPGSELQSQNGVKRLQIDVGWDRIG